MNRIFPPNWSQVNGACELDRLTAYTNLRMQASGKTSQEDRWAVESHRSEVLIRLGRIKVGDVDLQGEQGRIILHNPVWSKRALEVDVFNDGALRVLSYRDISSRDGLDNYLALYAASTVLSDYQKRDFEPLSLGVTDSRVEAVLRLKPLEHLLDDL